MGQVPVYSARCLARTWLVADIYELDQGVEAECYLVWSGLGHTRPLLEQEILVPHIEDLAQSAKATFHIILIHAKASAEVRVVYGQAAQQYQTVKS